MLANLHLVQEPVRCGARPEDATLAVYAVHGRGQSPEFMEGLAGRIALPGIAYLMPEASGNTWYPGGFLQPIEDNQPHLGHALETVAAQLAALDGQGIPPERTVLLGFSQGACLLSEFLLRRRDRYAAAVLHTGGYLGPQERAWPEDGAFDGMPVLLAAAAEDAWVPMHRIEATAAALAKAGAAVELTSYDDTEHHINEDSVARIRRLLRSLPSSKEH
jgi:phospholipase/carboxylesterase